MSLLSKPIVTKRGGNSRLLIDADFLAYQVGALSQYKEKKDNTCVQVCIDEDDDQWVWLEPENLVKWKVSHELDKLKDLCDSDNTSVYLTGEGNFRESLATSKVYKGTRSAPRPFYFQFIRDYLIQNHDAEVINDIEADDQVSIEQTRSDEDTIIVSQDKDLINTSGKLCVPREQAIYDVTEWCSVNHLLYQLVCGDRVDNIGGIPRRGGAWYQKNPDIDSIYREYYKKDSTGALLHEQLNLLHMLQYGDVPGEYTEDMLYDRYTRAMASCRGDELSSFQPWSRDEFKRVCTISSG